MTFPHLLLRLLTLRVVDDNLNIAKREAVRHFGNGKNAYLRAKFEETENNSKIKNIRNLCRGFNDFKKGYQPITNIVKDEKSDLVEDSHSILAGWKKWC